MLMLVEIILSDENSSRRVSSIKEELFHYNIFSNSVVNLILRHTVFFILKLKEVMTINMYIRTEMFKYCNR